MMGQESLIRAINQEMTLGDDVEDTDIFLFLRTHYTMTHAGFSLRRLTNNEYHNILRVVDAIVREEPPESTIVKLARYFQQTYDHEADSVVAGET